jgi:predicted NUDIX family phosphoesterase
MGQKKSIVPLKIDDFLLQCSQAGFEFVDRPAAEKDPSYKQIIPYIVLQTSDLKWTAMYHRQGSEKRLHDLCSVGIGGHINPIDMDEGTPSFNRILTTGMMRELSEELKQRSQKDTPVFEGVISEDITDVGKVHLGAVFRILTQEPDAYQPGEELYDFSWQPTDQLNQVNLELWSSLALKLLSQS